jgi:hypothetical protein
LRLSIIEKLSEYKRIVIRSCQPCKKSCVVVPIRAVFFYVEISAFSQPQRSYSMKRFAMALALMCVLSTSILAGDMPTGGKSEAPPPPPPALVTMVLTIISLI